MTAIRVRGLTKDFGPVRAVDDVTFTAPAGQVTGFLGPNGAGKTTTLRVLLGLVTPSSGTATIGDHAYVDLWRPGHVVGAVLEATGVHPGRRGRTHLRLLAEMAGIDGARVERVLDLVELTDVADRRVGGFSLGMRQRLAIAGALLGDPEVVVLDEPTNGLDPVGVRWLRDLLAGLAAEGRTVLVSSHLLAEVAQSASRAVVLVGGRLRFDGAIAELTADGSTLEDAFLRLLDDVPSGQVPPRPMREAS